MTICKSRAGLLIFMILYFSSAYGQEKSDITITTNPPGATVYLRGELDLVANTPASLPETISGRYKAEITRPGYETWKGDFTFLPGRPNSIAIRLSKKTRAKAALRSFIIPGWGQIYSGNKFRGYAISTGAVAAAAAIFHLDRRFDKKKADFEVAQEDYLNAMAIEDRIALKAILDERQNDAYDAETDRNTAIAIGVGLWTYNVIDALLFFPENNAYFPSVTYLDDGAALVYSFQF